MEGLEDLGFLLFLVDISRCLCYLCILNDENSTFFMLQYLLLKTSFSAHCDVRFRFCFSVLLEFLCYSLQCQISLGIGAGGRRLRIY